MLSQYLCLNVCLGFCVFVCACRNLFISFSNSVHRFLDTIKRNSFFPPRSYKCSESNQFFFRLFFRVDCIVIIVIFMMIAFCCAIASSCLYKVCSFYTILIVFYFFHRRCRRHRRLFRAFF